LVRLGHWPRILVLFAAVASCKSEPKPSASPAPSRSAKPAPTFPDFESLVMLDGRDSGAVAQGTTEGGTDAATEALGNVPPTPALKLLEPGAEPRTAARYDVPADKLQTTVATVRVAAEGAMPPGAGQQPPIKLTLQLMPKSKSPDGTVRFAVQVAKAEIVVGGAQLPPEAAKEIKAAEAAISKLGGGLAVNARGTIADVSFGGRGAPPELRELVMPIVELLFAPFPEEPIGVGAKWALLSEVKGEGSMKSTFTMTARTEKTADLSIETQRSSPPQAMPDPRAPPGVTMQLDGKGKAKMTVRFDGITSKVESDSKTNVTVKDPTSKPPRSQTSTIAVRHSLASP
jgi:hypothetical protein